VSSNIIYRRARKEIPGVYVVKIGLELQSYEEATVNVGRYRDRGYQCSDYYGGGCGVLRASRCYPRNPLEVESRIVNEYADIANVWVNDTITIEVRDKRLEAIGGGPYQIVRYTATMDGMNTEQLPCEIHGRVWAHITLNEINLVSKEAAMLIPPPSQPITKPGAIPHIPPVQITTVESARKKLNYKFITSEEIDSIIQLSARGGFIDFNQLTRTLTALNKTRKKEARAPKQGNLALQQAREIIESKL